MRGKRLNWETRESMPIAHYMCRLLGLDPTAICNLALSSLDACLQLPTHTVKQTKSISTKPRREQKRRNKDGTTANDSCIRVWDRQPGPIPGCVVNVPI